MNLLSNSLKHIEECAKVPSFSSYEERLHPYIREKVAGWPHIKEVAQVGNSLIFEYRKDEDLPALALSAHLDKINHYGYDYPKQLPVRQLNSYLEGGILDDSVGLGICMGIMEKCHELNCPSMYFFLTEMEESFGLRHHPELMKNNGAGLQHSQGAMNISNYCIEHLDQPELVITVDTTPIFKGKKGIALYSRFWELVDYQPDEKMIEETQKVFDQIKSINPNIVDKNNTNDYMVFGKHLNQNNGNKRIKSVALEPAIYPYHQKGEKVFIDDIRSTINTLRLIFERCYNKGFVL